MESITEQIVISPAFCESVRPANFRAALDARPDVVDRVLEDVQGPIPANHDTPVELDTMNFTGDAPSESEQSDWDEMNVPEQWDGGVL